MNNKNLKKILSSIKKKNKKIDQLTNSISKLENRILLSGNNLPKAELTGFDLLKYICDKIFFVKLGKLKVYKKNLQNEYIPKKINNKYKLSIIVPNYNGARYLKDTLKSIVIQKLTNYEIIFKDNLSSDTSLRIAKEFKKKIGNKIKILVKADKGQADGINQGFNQASGEIFCWINSDDMYLKDTFINLFDFIEKNKLNPIEDEFALYGNRYLINEDGLEINRWILPYHDKKILYYADYIPQETLFWSKKAMDKLKALDKKFKFAMDWELLLRMSNKNIKIYHINKMLGCFRVHNEQKTQTQISSIGNYEMNLLRKKNYKKIKYQNLKFNILKFFIFSHLLDKVYVLKRIYYLLKVKLFS